MIHLISASISLILSDSNTHKHIHTFFLSLSLSFSLGTLLQLSRQCVYTVIYIYVYIDIPIELAPPSNSWLWWWYVAWVQALSYDKSIWSIAGAATPHHLHCSSSHLSRDLSCDLSCHQQALSQSGERSAIQPAHPGKVTWAIYSALLPTICSASSATGVSCCFMKLLVSTLCVQMKRYQAICGYF